MSTDDNCGGVAPEDDWPGPVSEIVVATDDRRECSPVIRGRYAADVGREGEVTDVSEVTEAEAGLRDGLAVS